MGIWKYIYLIYLLITLCAVFIIVKPKRIKELLPVAFVGIAILFLTEKYLLTLGLYEFSNALVPILGIPLFHLLWGIPAAIILMNFIPRKFAWKLLVILAFTLITMAFEYFPEHHGMARHLGKYGEIHDCIQDYISLILVVWFSEGLFGRHIHSRQ